MSLIVKWLLEDSEAMALTLDQQLESLTSIILSATVHFGVWETFQEERARKDSVDVMNRFGGFFMPTIQAHFKALIASCYQLLDKRPDVVSFRSIGNALRIANHFDIEREPELSRQLGLMEPVWSKIQVLRHKSVAHFDRRLEQSDVFTSAGLSPQEIADFLQAARALLNKIMYKLRYESEAFNIERESREATRSLLRAIASAFDEIADFKPRA